jgi:uncharacterized repeat protein (TIGR03803 family)
MAKHSGLKKAYAVLLFCATTAISSPGQTIEPLASFDGTNGRNPFYMSLVQGTDGNFYGTTANGGSNDRGTVFMVSPMGMLTTLYSFCAPTNCADGASPDSALLQGNDGSFYGTNLYGGANDAGTVFKITKRGTLTTLYSFCSQPNCTDGNQSLAGLVQATDGNFYGTTYFGGPSNSGTVFKITRSGTLSTLHSFAGYPTEGANPIAGLIQARDVNFYGTTYGGPKGGGTVFKITPGGTLTTLYSFCVQTNCTDGDNPWAGLVQAKDGNFYGTTAYGGANNDGTVFRLSPGGTLTVLHSFDGADGASPFAGLIQATDGNLYGVTGAGGADGLGALFKMTLSGTVTPYSLIDTNGNLPYGGLVQSTSGNFYGTTYQGGSSTNCLSGCGTIFGLSVGLGPFVETQPTSGKTGARVIIQGNRLKGSTAVSFNGKEATFTVVSGSEITTTVPVGATTGNVEVTTPSGTLTSNILFRVIR